MKILKISEDISLPADIVTQTIAILAKRRAGKSYTMRKICEQLFEAEQQIIMVDPKGDQWGIRSSADGKSAGYPIIIFGGEHGDVPLEVNSGEIVAKLVVEERVSILLDLSIFRKHEIATFMTAFLENLYRLKAKEEYRTPVMLVIDEADAIAPQKPQTNEARMLGAAEDIVRRGGQRGIGCALITQRSAVLNKNVLTQAQMLIVLRTIAPQDLSAMKAWVDVHGTVEEGKMLMESLPSLPIGDAWFWSPGYPTEAGIFQRSHILPITTFDSGATPKAGEKKIIPKNLADINLDVLKKQMSDTIEKAKSEDPKLLKKRIAELEKMATLPKKEYADIEAIVAERIKTHIIAIESERQNWESLIKEWKSYSTNLYDAVIHASFELPKFVKGLNKPSEKPSGNYIIPKSHVSIDRAQKGSERTSIAIVHEGKTIDTFNADKPLTKGAKSVLSYLYSAYPKSKSKAQISVATGYSQGGGFNNILYELTGGELIEKDGTRYVSIGDYSQDNTFKPSLDLWKAKLSKGARTVFEYMLQFPQDQFGKEHLATVTGYALGGGFNNNIYELTGAELIKKIGTEYTINQEILDL